MNPHQRIALCLLAVLIAFGLSTTLLAQNGRNPTLVETRVKDLGPLPFDKDINNIELSPTGERLGYRLDHQRKAYLICDGKPGKAYEAVSGPGFSPDGRSLVYLASSAGAPERRGGTPGPRGVGRQGTRIAVRSLCRARVLPGQQQIGIPGMVRS